MTITESEACDYFYELMLRSIRLDKEFKEEINYAMERNTEKRGR